MSPESEIPAQSAHHDAPSQMLNEVPEPDNLFGLIKKAAQSMGKK